MLALSTAQYSTGNPWRRSQILTQTQSPPSVNGINYLAVTNTQTLSVTFFFGLATPGQTPPSPGVVLGVSNVVIAPAPGAPPVTVISAVPSGSVLTVTVSANYDASTYTLAIVNANGPGVPAGFDPQLCSVSFAFVTTGATEIDCRASAPAANLPEPHIDYLAKDFASFERLMLDRLAVTMPGWTERNTADLGMVLVDLLAYAADHLSYYQDAVATEAYLGTARQRISIRRHARLLNYPMHDGCNALCWACLQAGSSFDGQTLPGPGPDTPGSQLLTLTNGFSSVIPTSQVASAVAAGALVFETLEPVTLYQAHNEIHFYTWGNSGTVLPVGATSATLNNAGGKLRLAVGMVLIFEEVGNSSLAPDPTHRQAVRLTAVTPNRDALVSTPPLQLLDIQWATDDALQFALNLSESPGDLNNPPNQWTLFSVARGNVVLADQGYTLPAEPLVAVPDPTPLGRVRYRPLQQSPLTQQTFVRSAQGALLAVDPTTSAAAAFSRSMADVRPAVHLHEGSPTDSTPGPLWTASRDLLGCDSLARNFVAEVDDKQRAQLRFGDDVYGMVPQRPLYAIYRTGNGNRGNIGAEALAHVAVNPATYTALVTKNPAYSSLSPTGAILAVRNPLPAQGGVDPEPVAQVKLYAPQAYVTQQRAITDADYATILKSIPQVRQAVATRLWTGSFYTVCIAIARVGGLPVDAAFSAAVLAALEPYRMANQEVKLNGPVLVPLEVSLNIQVQSGYRQSAVLESLHKALGAAVYPDGTIGFFYLDNFSFGQPIYLSQLLNTVMQVPGVQSAQIQCFQRAGQSSSPQVVDRIDMGRLELPLLNSSAGQPSSGTLKLNLQGGL